LVTRCQGGLGLGQGFGTIEGNDITKTIQIPRYFSNNTHWPQMVIYFNFVEGVMDDEEAVLMDVAQELFAIGEVIILDIKSLEQPI